MIAGARAESVLAMVGSWRKEAWSAGVRKERRMSRWGVEGCEVSGISEGLRVEERRSA